MKIISTKTHGILDYVVGLLLIASPWIFGFATGGIEQWLPVILGVSALAYSLLTNYELGAIKVLSMQTHLTIDALSGLLLAASPWLFGFSDRVTTPHLVMGLFELAAVMMTRTKTSTGGVGNMKHSHAI
jgi:hypothetical protein